MTESLQEIERLVADLEYAVEQHRGDHNRDTVANRASAHHALLSAITRVVQERDAAYEVLAELAAQSSGVPGSTTRADCMAALANAHLRAALSTAEG